MTAVAAQKNYSSTSPSVAHNFVSVSSHRDRGDGNPSWQSNWNRRLNCRGGGGGSWSSGMSCNNGG